MNGGCARCLNHLLFSAPTEYTVGGDEEQVQGQYLLHKRLMDDVLAQSSGILGVPLASDIVGGQDKKRRKTTTEQQVKRHRYDVLKAFFRVYFCESKDAMVLKDAIFNLYTKKIPANQRCALELVWGSRKNICGRGLTAEKQDSKECYVPTHVVILQESDFGLPE